MKAGKPLIGIGITILISGMVFSLQGQAVVGPESSFMYSNPEWITYGHWIMIAGIMMLAVGIMISKNSSLRHPK
ncbi:MAG TPA: hypothetical protein VJZ17_05515 [Nitrosopumilaceae archaeon]|nr:hypothetical protein [Nitrosopumilaceae archaeon]